MKNIKLVLIGIIAVFAGISQRVAQDSNSVRASSSYFDVEIDPLAYILKGYSVHLGYNRNHVRWNLGFVGFEYPEDFNDNSGVTARTNGLSLKWDYINPKWKGFYFGPQSDLSQLKLTSIENSAESETIFQATIGLRVGYRLMFGSEKGFYLNAWAAYIYNTTSEVVEVGNNFYEIPAHIIFPTVHLGWRF